MNLAKKSRHGNFELFKQSPYVAFRNAGDLTDFFLRQSIASREQTDFERALRQLCGKALDNLPKICADRWLLCRMTGIVRCIRLAHPPTPQSIDRCMRRHAIDPSHAVELAPLVYSLFPEANERLLRRIFGLVSVEEHASAFFPNDRKIVPVSIFNG